MAERARLEGELIAVGERERVRLGRDLHDDLGQLLTGIAFLSSAMERRLSAHAGTESDSAGEIRGLVQEAIAKTHRLALGLAPVDLGGDGLVAAIRELAGITERAFGVTCLLECRTAPSLEDPLTATSLYRITQEAISNAVRHGKARHIRITLNTGGGRIQLTVSDDGVGLAGSPDTPGGLGLRIMKQRAEELGGTFEIRADGLGTAVICQVPEGAVSDTGSDRVGIDPSN
jgi:signal transduction histidine kinase